MGAPRKADWREERRKRAWTLKEQGWRQKDVATALEVSEGAVSQWLKRGREGRIYAEYCTIPPACLGFNLILWRSNKKQGALS